MKELADRPARALTSALYCFVFLFIAASGSGTWSIDALRGKKSR